MKKILLLIIAAFIVWSTMACSKEKNLPKDNPLKVKIGSASVPGDPHNTGMRKVVEVLNNDPKGRFDATFYDSASLFGQKELLPALKQGNIDMVLDLAAPWFVNDMPEIGMFTAGYLFKNYNHMTSVLNGNVSKILFDSMAKKIGIRPLGA